MSELDEWSKKQAEPLGIFDLASKWSEAIKVVGAGNGAGLIAAGAALSSFSKSPMLPCIKIGGSFFFIGVMAFAISFALIQLAIFSHDEMLHAIRAHSAQSAEKHKQTSSSAMIAANRLAIVSALSFIGGLFFGLIAFLKS